MALRIGDQYVLGKKLGSGSFGQIFEGKERKTGRRVAIKLEERRAQAPQLKYEYRLYNALAGGAGIPAVHWYGEEGDYRVLVMDRLGKSLEQLFTQCGRKFSLKTVLLLADQMLSRIEYIHRKQFVHRDIKPDNFLVGQGPFENVVFLIDFGLAKRFVDPTTKEHIPYRDDKQLTGTARYASLHAHQGCEQSRRDDLEALGYLWLYFLRGKLPWQGLAPDDDGNKYEKIAEIKKTIGLKELCRDVPREFYEYFKRIRGMTFDQTPDYAGLRRLLAARRQREGFEMDYQFDWKQTAETSHGGGHSSDDDDKLENTTQVVELMH